MKVPYSRGVAGSGGNYSGSIGGEATCESLPEPLGIGKSIFVREPYGCTANTVTLLAICFYSNRIIVSHGIGYLGEKNVISY